MRKYSWLLAVLLCLSLGACASRTEEPPATTEPPSVTATTPPTTEAAATEAPTAMTTEATTVPTTTATAPLVTAMAPTRPATGYDKYATNDRYLVAQPRGKKIVTFTAFGIQDSGFHQYTAKTWDVPDYMITVFDYLLPIEEKYGALAIDGIVWDEKTDRICVNFAANAPLLTKMEEKQRHEVLHFVAMTIMENEEQVREVYFEANKKPLPVYVIYPNLYFIPETIAVTTERGTAEDAAAIQARLKSIKQEEVLAFYAAYMPSDYYGIYPLGAKDVATLLAMWGETELVPFPKDYPEEDNPALGGAEIYEIETARERLKILVRAGSLCNVWDRNTGEVVSFRDGVYRGDDFGPGEYIYQRQQSR